jgi:hypothetical protein
MKEFSCNLQSHMPEHCIVEFNSNGTQGGDSGHGGYAMLEFRENGGHTNMEICVDLENGQQVHLEDLSKVNITVRGDWELEWLAIALMDLGRKMLQRDDIINDYVKWTDTGSETD